MNADSECVSVENRKLLRVSNHPSFSFLLYDGPLPERERDELGKPSGFMIKGVRSDQDLNASAWAIGAEVVHGLQGLCVNEMTEYTLAHRS